MPEPAAARLARVTRLATLGWVGDDPGDRVGWLRTCGWVFAPHTPWGVRRGLRFEMSPRPGPFTLPPVPVFRMR